MTDDRFTFFRSYYEALKTMKPAERDQAVMGLLGAYFDGIEPKNLRPAAALFLLMAMPVVSSRKRGGQPGNANAQRQERRETNRKRMENESETNKNESETNKNESETNKNDSKTNLRNMDHGSWIMDQKQEHGSEVRERGSEGGGGAGGEPAGTPAPAPTQDLKFHLDRIPPDTDEIEEYARQKGIPHSTAVKFYMHYSANGWMMGENRMVNWGAALIKWAKNGIT